MEIFEAKPKHWGNSLGITIPKEIAQKSHITTQKKIKLLLINSEMDELKKAFGSLKLKKNTQEVMEEIDQNYD